MVGCAIWYCLVSESITFLSSHWSSAVQRTLTGANLLLVLGLCGTCIYLILAEDWVQDQCCPCGCASCERLPAGMNGSLTNHAFHINRTRIPEFCNDPAFDCDSCLTGYKNPLLKIKNSDNPIAGIIQPLLLSITTALIPLLTKQIRLVERRADMADEMRVTLIRVFFLKMFNIGLMFGVSSISDVPPSIRSDLILSTHIRPV